MNKYYTGIGSRNAPQWALAIARRIAFELVSYGYTLRSGAAEGMDSAFETGCDMVRGNKEIYLPWAKFNNHPSQLYIQDELAVATAKRLHPKWESLSQGARKLHTRNVYQIVGHDWQTASRFVICYTPWDKGGTLQALRLANEMGISICNLWDYDSSLWDITSEKGINEILDSILNQVLVKRYRLIAKEKKPKEPFIPQRFIHTFRNDYKFLSNFYECEFKYNGKLYYSVENAYQSHKTDPPDERIRVAGTASEAKRLGRMIKLRRDWEEVKENLMFEFVKAKFEQNKDIREKLINTGNAILTEDNTWHDNEWGDCRCDNCSSIEGKNKLGKTLMRVRELLKKPPFYCKLFSNYRYDGKCNDMACEFCNDYYDPNRKQWWYHPESESYVYTIFKEDNYSIHQLENVDDKIKTRVVNINKDEYDVFIGRGSKYGNPYKIGVDGDRKTVIEKFQDYLYNNDSLKKDILSLKGLRLGCYCSPEDCHGDIIAEYIENNTPHIKDNPYGK